MRVLALGGSLRAHALSTAALKAGLHIAQIAGAQTELCDLRELDLPVYRPEEPLSSYPRPAQERIAELVRRFRRADAMLWATPTYHGSMSGAIKNALDYTQLLADDPAPYLQGKPVGLIAIATSSPIPHLAACAAELRAWVAPTRLTLDSDDFDADLSLASEVAMRRLRRMVSELMTFATLRP